MFVDFVASRSKIACGFYIYTVVINSACRKSHFCTMNGANIDGVSINSSSSSVQSTPEIEKKYVHCVYDAIAPHFSSTRFAKWPKVATFLNSLPLGSLVLDAGCGNGKYLGLNPDCFFIGCDISAPLISICADRGQEVVVADAVNLPYRTGYGDAAISIAVLHHLSTANRRKKAIDELIRVVKKGGLVLITVWAVEQEDRTLLNKWTPLTDKYSEEWIGPSSHAIRSPSSSTLESIPESEKYSSEWIGPSTPAIRNPLSSTLESIPESEKYSSEWIGPSSPAIRNPSSSTLESIPESEKYSSEWIGPSSPAIRSPSSSTLESIPESEENSLGERLRDFRGNMNLPETMPLNSQNKDHLTATENGKKGENQQEFFIPWHLPYHRAEVSGASSCAIANGLAKKDDKKGAVVYNRYYHVFSEGELERLVSGTENAVVVDRFYDKSNWCIILEKTL